MSETFTPQNLIAGPFPNVGVEITLLSGSACAIGSVMGIITTSGKAIPCDHTASDGSENPYCVALEAATASGADVTHIPAYLTGEFNENKLSFGGSSTLADLKRAMRDVCIFAKPARIA